VSRRILVLGAGAVGGYFGALLARGGHEVAFVARGATLDALRRDGLTVRLETETLRLQPVTAVAEPAAAPSPDLVLVCVKSHDTVAAAAALRPALGPDSIVLSLQNGIENEAVLARELGLPPLMVALTRIGVAMVAPGVIEYSGRGTIVFGEPDGQTTARARRAAEIFETAAVPHQLRADILVAAWEKLAWNAGFNAVSTLTRATVAELLCQPGARELVVAAMEEVDAVAEALGVPVRRRRTPAVLEDSLTGLPDFQTSMLQDLLRGRRLEHDALNGAVVRAGARAGVAVPVNRMLLALLARLDPAGRTSDSAT
jgi:2-dehydropantoate 2-reductase